MAAVAGTGQTVSCTGTAAIGKRKNVAHTEKIKALSLVQPNFQTGPTNLNVFYLPYSVGCIWSYAVTNPVVASSYSLDQIIWHRDSVDATAEKLSNNHIVVFGTYVWNRQYNYTLSKKIKKINPNVVTIFGGPEIPIGDPDIFVKHPFMDYVVKKEGEQVFQDLLLYLANSELSMPPGLLVNQQGIAVDTGAEERIFDLSALPSPYLTGFFDKIVAEHPTVAWTATLETNRGCPYQCTFCDWGSLTYNKTRLFPIERVFADIEWIGTHCNGVWTTDANFGMFVDRDRSIVDKIIAVHRQGPGLKYFYTNWAKNQKTEVIDLIKKFNNESTLISNGLTVSVQSMTPKVLDIIKRTNLKQHNIKEIFKLAETNKLWVYTELILGLPGETSESFMDAVFKIINAGNHHGIDIFQCQLLENSELTRVQKDIYNIKTVDWSDYISPLQNISEQDHELTETIAVTTETSSLSKADMLSTMSWIAFMTAFHFYGFSTQISRFINNYCNESYQDFYSKLYNQYRSDTYFGQLHTVITKNYSSLLEQGKLIDPLITLVPINAVNISSGILMRVHIDQTLNYTFEFLFRFINQHYDLPSDLAQQLLDYQQQVLLTYEKVIGPDSHSVSYDYDFCRYIEQGSNLFQATNLTFSTKTMQQNQSYVEFIENLYFRKKQQFGLLTVSTHYC